MKKKYEKLAKIVKKFIDNDCDVCYDKEDFSYSPTKELITFTFDDDEESNREWKKFLAEEFGFTLTKENLFTMSVLHELGHHYTVNFFSDEQWEDEANERDLAGLTGAEKDRAYFRLPIEKAATMWAVLYYNARPKYMQTWNHRFSCMIKHYEKKEKRTLLTNF